MFPCENQRVLRGGVPSLCGPSWVILLGHSGVTGRRMPVAHRSSCNPSPLQSLESSGDQSHKMPTDRCARLTLVSTANDLKEAWISDHPYLAVTYLWQYAPTWAWWLMNRMGKRRIQNFKSGVVSLFLSPLLALHSADRLFSHQNVRVAFWIHFLFVS